MKSNRLKSLVLVLAAVSLTASVSQAFECEVTEIDFSLTPASVTKKVPSAGRTEGDRFADVRVVVDQAKSGTMHITVEDTKRNHFYGAGFGRVEVGVTAFLNGNDDSRQIVVICKDQPAIADSCDRTQLRSWQ